MHIILFAASLEIKTSSKYNATSLYLESSICILCVVLNRHIIFAASFAIKTSSRLFAASFDLETSVGYAYAHYICC
jgi:hypothetical protein